MNEENERKLRKLNEAINTATGSSYQPRKSTTWALSQAIGGEDAEVVLTSLSRNHDSETFDGDMLLVGPSLVAHVHLEAADPMNGIGQFEGPMMTTTVRRAALRAVAVRTPRRQLVQQFGQEDRTGLTRETEIELTYEGLPAGCSYKLDRYDDDARLAVIARFQADLALA